jgi:hypothetical protein
MSTVFFPLTPTLPTVVSLKSNDQEEHINQEHKVQPLLDFPLVVASRERLTKRSSEDNIDEHRKRNANSDDVPC